MSFDKVWGHKEAVRLLKAAIQSGHIGHAYIFEGAFGVGKYTLATAFAKAILGIESETHPDLITVTNALYGEEKKKDGLSIDSVRQMRQDVYVKPYLAKQKVYILPHGDLMGIEAQNCLLKVFEEPPEYCTIIILAENANALLQTIRSRAVLLRLHPLAADEVEDYLTENTDLSGSSVKVKACMSGGSIGRALLLIEDTQADALRTELIDNLCALSGGGNKSVYDLVKFLGKNKEKTGLIFDTLKSWFLDLMHIKQLGKNAKITNADKADILASFSAKLTKTAPMSCLEAVVKYEGIIAANANYSVACLCMATELREEIHGRNYRSTI